MLFAELRCRPDRIPPRSPLGVIGPVGAPLPVHTVSPAAADTPDDSMSPKPGR